MTDSGAHPEAVHDVLLWRFGREVQQRHRPAPQGGVTVCEFCEPSAVWPCLARCWGDRAVEVSQRSLAAMFLGSDDYERAAIRAALEQHLARPARPDQ
jgi:hypothetical protein